MTNTLDELLAQLQQSDGQAGATDGSQKTAMTKDPVEPSEGGHPAEGFEDRAKVPEGPEIQESSEEQRAANGDVAAAAAGPTNPDDATPETVNTDVDEGGDDANPALQPGEGVQDPGPDSDHPASPNNVAHKYASMNDPAEILNGLADICGQISVKLAADPSALAAPAQPGQGETEPGDDGKTASASASADGTEPAGDDTAGKQAASPEETPESQLVQTLRELLPTEKLANAATARVTQDFSPYIQAGIERANKVASFLQAVETNPKLASDMMADPAAMGADPGADGAPPMDPAAAGGEGAMGGEGDEMQELLAVVEQLSAETGLPAEEVLAQLLGEIEGAPAGEAAAAPAEGGEAAPPAADPAAAPVEGAPAEGKSDPDSEESPESGEESGDDSDDSDDSDDDDESGDKTAAAPVQPKGKTDKKPSKTAQARAGVVQELARELLAEQAKRV